MSISVSKTDRYKFIVLGILLVLTVMIRLPVLLEPWGADQAVIGQVAKGILENKVPYKDSYSLIGYGVFFTFALFFKLFGINMTSAHLGHILVSSISVILVFLLADRLYGRKVAVIASLCYTVFSNGMGFSGFGYENASSWGTYWYLSQREVFMAPFIMGAIFLNTDSNKDTAGPFRCFLSGVFIGLAAIYKLTAMLMLFLLIAFLFIEGWRNKTPGDLKNALKKIFTLLSGFISIHLPFLYYFWVHDALSDMYHALFLHLSFYTKLSRGMRIETLFSGHFSVMGENLILWAFAFIATLHMLFTDRTRNNILMATWGLGSLLMVWIQGKFFGYHFLLLMPPFAVLAAYGFQKFLPGGSGIKDFVSNNLRDIRKIFILTTIFLSIIEFGISNYDYYKRHLNYFLGKISQTDYYNLFNEFPTHPYSFRSDYQIVKYLQKNGAADNKLGVVFSAGDTIVHFLSGMKPATRFVQSWYLFSSNAVLSKNRIIVQLRKEFIDQMIRAAPQFILCVYMPLNEIADLPFLKEDPNVKRLSQFVHANYRAKIFPDKRFLFIKS